MPLHYRAWRDTLDPLEIEFNEQTFYDLAGMPSPKVLEQIAAGRFSETEVEQIVQRRESAFFDLLDQIQPVTAVVEIARQRRGALPMAVASGSVRTSVDKQLHALGIQDWFQTIVAAEDTTRHKPEPDVFLEAARRLGVPANQCRVFEDAELGLQAARRAGMEAVDVRRWYAD